MSCFSPKTLTRALILWFSLLAPPLAASDVFVDQIFGSSTNGGTSWIDAVTTIKLGLQFATTGDTIHVSEGIYLEQAVVTIPDLTMIGGYSAGGSVLDPCRYRSIIDARDRVESSPSAAVYAWSNLVIDGFVIIAHGGNTGIRTYPGLLEVRNCVFFNHGEGAYTNNVDVVIDRCIFVQTRSGYNGDYGVYCYGASLVCRNSSFFGGNYSVWFTSVRQSEINSCTIFGANNVGIRATATAGGFALRNNLVFGGNDRGIYVDLGAWVIENNNSWGNVRNWSGIIPVLTGISGNLSADPAIDSGIHLTTSSPCIDAGTFTGSPSIDFEGDPRPSGANPDIGADELGGPLSGCSPVDLLAPEVISINAVDSIVAPGASGLPVAVVVRNPSEFTELGIDSIDFSFTGLLDRTSEYVVTPDPGNPTLIASGGTAILNFTVDVSVVASQEVVVIDATCNGLISVAQLPMRGSGALVTDRWFVGAGSAQFGANCGDCTGDGSSDTRDAFVAAQFSVGMFALTPIAFDHCNVIGAPGGPTEPGATVDIMDALRIARSVVGIDLPLPVCKAAPTCVINVRELGLPADEVFIDIFAISADSSAVHAEVEWSSDSGVVWQPITEGPRSQGTQFLETSPTPGTRHTVTWDTSTDGLGLGQSDQVLIAVRVTRAMGSETSSCITPPLLIRNGDEHWRWLADTPALSQNMCLDSSRRKLFTGHIPLGGGGGLTLSEFDLATSTWRYLQPMGTAPAFRGGFAMEFDPVLNRVLIFGGSYGAAMPIYFNDLWELSFAGGGDGEWRQMVPAGLAPSPRRGMGSVMDSIGGRHRMLIFGGDMLRPTPPLAYIHLNEVWELDLTFGVDGEWRQIMAAGTLPAMRDFAIALDPIGNQVVVA